MFLPPRKGSGMKKIVIILIVGWSIGLSAVSRESQTRPTWLLQNKAADVGKMALIQRGFQPGDDPANVTVVPPRGMALLKDKAHDVGKTALALKGFAADDNFSDTSSVADSVNALQDDLSAKEEARRIIEKGTDLAALDINIKSHELNAINWAIQKAVEYYSIPELQELWSDTQSVAYRKVANLLWLGMQVNDGYRLEPPFSESITNRLIMILHEQDDFEPYRMKDQLNELANMNPRDRKDFTSQQLSKFDSVFAGYNSSEDKKKWNRKSGIKTPFRYLMRGMSRLKKRKANKDREAKSLFAAALDRDALKAQYDQKDAQNADPKKRFKEHKAVHYPRWWLHPFNRKKHVQGRYEKTPRIARLLMLSFMKSHNAFSQGLVANFPPLHDEYYHQPLEPDWDYVVAQHQTFRGAVSIYMGAKNKHDENDELGFADSRRNAYAMKWQRIGVRNRFQQMAVGNVINALHDLHAYLGFTPKRRTHMRDRARQLRVGKTAIKLGLLAWNAAGWAGAVTAPIPMALDAMGLDALLVPETLHAPDGTITVTDADGTTTITAPDGTTMVIETDGTTTITAPDGTTTISNPVTDGPAEITTTNTDGTVTQVETTVDPTDNSITITRTEYESGATIDSSSGEEVVNGTASRAKVISINGDQVTVTEYSGDASDANMTSMTTSTRVNGVLTVNQTVLRTTGPDGTVAISTYSGTVTSKNLESIQLVQEGANGAPNVSTLYTGDIADVPLGDLDSADGVTKVVTVDPTDGAVATQVTTSGDVTTTATFDGSDLTLNAASGEITISADPTETIRVTTPSDGPQVIEAFGPGEVTEDTIPLRTTIIPESGNISVQDHSTGEINIYDRADLLDEKDNLMVGADGAVDSSIDPIRTVNQGTVVSEVVTTDTTFTQVTYDPATATVAPDGTIVGTPTETVVINSPDGGPITRTITTEDGITIETYQESASVDLDTGTITGDLEVTEVRGVDGTRTVIFSDGSPQRVEFYPPGTEFSPDGTAVTPGTTTPIDPSYTHTVDSSTGQTLVYSGELTDGEQPLRTITQMSGSSTEVNFTNFDGDIVTEFYPEGTEFGADGSPVDTTIEPTHTHVVDSSAGETLVYDGKIESGEQPLRTITQVSGSSTEVSFTNVDGDVVTEFYPEGTDFGSDGVPLAGVDPTHTHVTDSAGDITVTAADGTTVTVTRTSASEFAVQKGADTIDVYASDSTLNQDGTVSGDFVRREVVVTNANGDQVTQVFGDAAETDLLSTTTVPTDGPITVSTTEGGADVIRIYADGIDNDPIRSMRTVQTSDGDIIVTEYDGDIDGTVLRETTTTQDSGVTTVTVRDGSGAVTEVTRTEPLAGGDANDITVTRYNGVVAPENWVSTTDVTNDASGVPTQTIVTQPDGPSIVQETYYGTQDGVVRERLRITVDADNNVISASKDNFDAVGAFESETEYTGDQLDDFTFTGEKIETPVS